MRSTPTWLCTLFILLPALLPLVNGQCLNTNPNCVYWNSHSTYPTVCDQTVIDAVAGCLSCYDTSYSELDAILANCSKAGYTALTIPVVGVLPMPTTTILFPSTPRVVHSHPLPSDYSTSIEPPLSPQDNSTTQVTASNPKTSSNGSYVAIGVLIGVVAGVAVMSFFYIRRRRRKSRRDTDGMNGVSLLLHDREKSEIPRVYTGYDDRYYRDRQNSVGTSSNEYLSAPKNAYVPNPSGPAVAPIPFLGAAPTIPMPITNIPPSPFITSTTITYPPKEQRNNGLGPLLLTGGKTSPIEERNYDMIRGPNDGSYTNLPYNNTGSY